MEGIKTIILRKCESIEFGCVQCTTDETELLIEDLNGLVDAVDEAVKERVEAKLKELEHHKNCTSGLYAIDFDPKELINRFINSQSDACNLEEEEAGKLHNDWAKWIDNKNIGESPFIKID